MNAADRQLIADVLAERKGWTITSDHLGRVGQRLVSASRVVDGITRCVVDLAEDIEREYDANRDYWTSRPTGTWRAPVVRPCFAPGVIL